MENEEDYRKKLISKWGKSLEETIDECETKNQKTITNKCKEKIIKVGGDVL